MHGTDPAAPVPRRPPSRLPIVAGWAVASVFGAAGCGSPRPESGAPEAPTAAPPGVQAAAGANAALELAVRTRDEGAVRVQFLAWAKMDPAAALGWLRDHPGVPGADELWPAAVGLDAGAAEQVARQHLGAARWERLHRALAEHWAVTQPARALMWVQRLDGTERLVLTREIFAEWSGENPAQARLAAARLPAEDDRLLALSTVARRDLARDPAAALAWIQAHPEPFERGVLILEAMPVWARHDGPGAARHTDRLPDGDHKTVLASYLARSWAEVDPERAVAWSATLGDSEARDEALRGSLGAVVAADPVRAAELARGLASDPDRAAALDLVVSEWSARDPSAVRAWAEGLGDTPARTEVLRRLTDLERSPPSTAAPGPP